MAVKPLPSQMDLRQLLNYSPDTGALTWLKRPLHFFPTGGKSPSRSRNTWNSRYAGTPALNSLNAHGYKSGRLLDRTTLSHRVIFAIQEGQWPTGQVDHINGDRADNRWNNLRQVSHQNNAKNMRLPSHNTSGHIGVYWDVRRGKWGAVIQANRKRKFIGYFDHKCDAVAARLKASIDLGFHPNHGSAAVLASIGNGEGE